MRELGKPETRRDRAAITVFLFMTLISAVMAFWSAVHADFTSTAGYFYCAMLWFNIALKDLECIAMIKRMERDVHDTRPD